MIRVKLESNIKNGDNTNFKDINPGDFVEFSIPGGELDKEYEHGDTIRVGPLTGLMWDQDGDRFLIKVTGNPLSNKKTNNGKVYKVEYHYDFYDDYGNGDPKSATFIGSVLIHADSPEDAIDKIDMYNDEIWNEHYPYIDGDPYDFEVVGEWDSIEEYEREYPGSNIPLLESTVRKINESESFYDKYKYYFKVGGIDCPNPTFTDDFRRYCTRAGIPCVYYSAWIKNGKPYYNNYGYLYLLKDKSDIQKVYNILKDHDMLGIREENIYGPNEFNKDEWILQDMDSDKDAYVIYSHPMSDKYYHSKNPQRYEKAVYLMNAKNDHEAEREYWDYFDKHKGNGFFFFYKKMKKGVAERIFKNKKTESVIGDQVYVMCEYASYPESGIEADTFEPLFIMNATNEQEAEEELRAYEDKNREFISKYCGFEYVKMSREQAIEELGDPNEVRDPSGYSDFSEYLYGEKYIPVKEALEDDPEEAEQEYSSADTSINSSRLPALFRMVKFDNGSLNLDYGGGKYDNVAEYLKSEYGATNLVYDKYNRSSEHNKEVLNQVRKNGGADTVTCSNVLNVIKEPEARLAVIKNCKNYLKSGGTAYFTVYEGKGNGNEGATKSGYQLNRKTADYMDEIKSVFSNVVRKGKLIVAK